MTSTARAIIRLAVSSMRIYDVLKGPGRGGRGYKRVYVHACVCSYSVSSSDHVFFLFFVVVLLLSASYNGCIREYKSPQSQHGIDTEVMIPR